MDSATGSLQIVEGFLGLCRLDIDVYLPCAGLYLFFLLFDDVQELRATTSSGLRPRTTNPRSLIIRTTNEVSDDSVAPASGAAPGTGVVIDAAASSLGGHGCLLRELDGLCEQLLDLFNRLIVLLVFLPLQVLHLRQQVQASIVPKHLRLLFLLYFTVTGTLLLYLGIVASVQSKGVCCTRRCWYFVLLNYNIGTVVRDVNPQVQMCGGVDRQIDLFHKINRYKDLLFSLILPYEFPSESL